MNQLVGDAAGFSVGHTVESHTKGIWLCSEAVEAMTATGEVVQMLFMDSEGLGATDKVSGARLWPTTARPRSRHCLPPLPTTAPPSPAPAPYLPLQNIQHDTTVFSLAALLCSTLVFNATGTIDESSIAQLGFIANLTKHIRLRSNNSATGGAGAAAAAGGAASGAGDAADASGGGDAASAGTGSDFGRFFPSFVWVLRDFLLALIDEDGAEMSPDDYMEAALEEQAGYDKDTMVSGGHRRRYPCSDAFGDDDGWVPVSTGCANGRDHFCCRRPTSSFSVSLLPSFLARVCVFGCLRACLHAAGPQQDPADDQVVLPRPPLLHARAARR